MPLLVTGTIGIDTVETPHGLAQDVLGGSAAYFALAASLITPVRLVGVVGSDFPPDFRGVFKGRPIDLAGLETRPGSKTFRWAGKYVGDMNAAETLRTDLNVISETPPKIPEQFRDSRYVFLANTHPALQRGFIEQLNQPKLIVCDTMNLWINVAKEELLQTLKMVNGMVMNDGEARLLTGHVDLIQAGHDVLKLGPEFVAIKKGEHGVLMVTKDEVVALPAYPTMKVKDPTGAGDSFAAGVMAYLASTDRRDTAALRAALAHGTCLASITIEDFSMRSLAAADKSTLDSRLARYKSMLSFS
jgi:sugar/nucleoside kinase (ribokinase family)